MSESLSRKLTKYGVIRSTVAEFKGAAWTKTDSWNNGQESVGFNTVIQPDGWVKCKSEGRLKYDIVFAEGGFELKGGVVRIKNGTRISVNGVSYVFARGSYSKQSR